MTRYATHPLERNFEEWNQKRKDHRMAYWFALRRASADYSKLTDQAQIEDTTNGFYYFLQQNYGLKPELIDGKYSGNYAITDERKFLLFQLQYWQ